MIRTNNPMLREGAFVPGYENFASASRPATMTVNGVVNRTLILLGLCAAASVFSWSWVQANPHLMMPAFWGSLLIGLILSLAMAFKPHTSPLLAPIGGIVEGVFVGTISLVYAKLIEGKTAGEYLGSSLILQAALLTFGIMLAMLLAYKSGLIKVTPGLRAGIVMATLGIAFFFLVTILLQLFGVAIPWLWDGGPVSILIAGFVVVIASMNLLLDFDLISEGQRVGAPRHMEWYAAWGLLVTLVWLYISLLRLLYLLAGRRD